MTRFSNARPPDQAAVNVPRARLARSAKALGVKVANEGASPEVLHALGIPLDWAERCEDAAHVGHDSTSDSLALRLEGLPANQFSNFQEEVSQLGSHGPAGAVHFLGWNVRRFVLGLFVVAGLLLFGMALTTFSCAAVVTFLHRRSIPDHVAHSS